MLLFEVLDIETQEGVLGTLHRGGLVVLVLPQEQEVLAQLVLGEGGRVALKVLGELADVTHILLFGGSAKIFKLDVLLELGDRGIVNYHRLGSMPVNAGNFPAKRLRS